VLAASIFSFFSASHWSLHLARANSFCNKYFSYLSLVFSVLSFFRVGSCSALMIASFSYLSWVHSSIICSMSSWKWKLEDVGLVQRRFCLFLLT
jgi:hypothetical protein